MAFLPSPQAISKALPTGRAGIKSTRSLRGSPFFSCMSESISLPQRLVEDHSNGRGKVKAPDMFGVNRDGKCPVHVCLYQLIRQSRRLLAKDQVIASLKFSL